MLQIKHINEHIVLGILDLALFSKKQPQTGNRELEKAGSKYTIKTILQDNEAEIAYHLEGKPYLKNRPEHISISHSHDKLAVIINGKENTGLDIELIRDKVKLIQHKFLNELEKKETNDDTQNLIIYWAAKETLYKLHGLKGLDFIKNISIEHFENNKIIGKITINEHQKLYLLNWEKLDNYILVYCINEI